MSYRHKQTEMIKYHRFDLSNLLTIMIGFQHSELLEMWQISALEFFKDFKEFSSLRCCALKTSHIKENKFENKCLINFSQSIKMICLHKKGLSEANSDTYG